MLHLKRVQYFNEWIRCKVSGRILSWGDWYYEDDEDGLVVCALEYKKMQQERKEEQWDYSRIQMAENEREYKQRLKELEREHIKKTLLDRQMAADKARGGDK